MAADAAHSTPEAMHNNIRHLLKANSEKEAYEKASKQFKDIQSYVGNGGTDKLIGVEGACTIAADEPVVWDDVYRE